MLALRRQVVVNMLGRLSRSSLLGTNSCHLHLRPELRQHNQRSRRKMPLRSRSDLWQRSERRPLRGARKRSRPKKLLSKSVYERNWLRSRVWASRRKSARRKLQQLPPRLKRRPPPKSLQSPQLRPAPARDPNLLNPQWPLRRPPHHSKHNHFHHHPKWRRRKHLPTTSLHRCPRSHCLLVSLIDLWPRTHNNDKHPEAISHPEPTRALPTSKHNRNTRHRLRTHHLAIASNSRLVDHQTLPTANSRHGQVPHPALMFGAHQALAMAHLTATAVLPLCPWRSRLDCLLHLAWAAHQPRLASRPKPASVKSRVLPTCNSNH